jgi:hypothetical protein
VKKEVASRQAKPPFVIHQTGQKKDIYFWIRQGGAWVGVTL